MSSLFGNTANQGQSQGTGLFGQNQGGGSLFGNTTAQNQTASQGGLFGGGNNTAQTQNQGASLFGSNDNNTQQATGAGLFGGNTNTQQSTGNGLFGGNTTQQQSTGTGLFGASNTQNQPQQQQTGGGLFGSNTNNQAQPQSTSLFGGGQQQANSNSGGGLFGTQSTAQPNTLFSSTQQQQQPQKQEQPQLQANGSLFPAPNPVPNRSFAERTFNHPQQTHLSSLLQSGLGSNPSAFGTLGTTSQTDLARSRLAAQGITAIVNEKSTFEQVQTLVRKWDPNSQDTLMQKYLYNAVNSSFAPFYHRNADENEKDWEEALSKKPASIENKDGDNVSFVPILVRGFKALGERVEYQATAVNQMRARLHEMNNSLDAIMATHQQTLTVRLENARRQHAALAQRTLRLAVKAQTFRNRGYPLDGAEEVLRRTLLSMETKVFDPGFVAREEEIWARMVSLRDRARWLEEEAKRVAGQAASAAGSNGTDEITDEVLVKTKKILADYEGQIRHLGKELEAVKKEFQEWQEKR